MGAVDPLAGPEHYGIMKFPTRWVVWIVLVAALAFLAGGVTDIVNHERNEAIAALSIGTFLLVIFFHQRREQRAEAVFRAWLAANAAALPQAGAHYQALPSTTKHYQDRWVTAATPTRQFTLVVSILIVSFKLPSRPLIEGADPIADRAVIYTLLTLLLGWWILHGLIWTPGALVANARGGRLSTLGEEMNARGIAAQAVG
jgi:hypothetical protein